MAALSIYAAMTNLILDVKGLRKRFATKPKETVAVAGVDFSIKRGECLETASSRIKMGEFLNHHFRGSR